MNTIDVLKGARELLSDPERWTKGEYARDAHGHGVPPTSADAHCWCLYGAAYKIVGGEDGEDVIMQALASCVPERHRTGRYAAAADFNDDPATTHPDLLAALDCAIAKASA